MPTIVVSFRLKPEEIAKALDGLLENNVDASNLDTISSIIRTTFYHGIISLCKDPSKIASIKARQKIKQLVNQNKRTKNIGIKELLSK